ncbi:hypothetical protein Agabi119p4_6017 [Agaricus bisporus var. burnettii]|uniref:Galactose mutarotase-like protein n=1 Tax=Agaricus bisporus var. burnettii TaxID=192524 RepID=A0A8H7KG82_AGABI|nr:hypothetical protein AGABI2DRAFT_191563 [Agaricus bisporus var. bisporus H97]EKV49600.1 hypothetical protein AGABI2DRAFT_191563 [Agaricus bisporus var. bisporus H97]KAF7771706.1 hypothetical protein Agabi119p4_6017 [Agaricus bisporus var. burnettii]
MDNNVPVLLQLPGENPSLKLEILPRGLTIHRLLVQDNGRENDIVIGPEKPEGHITQKYTNSIVGRYANRVPVGKHILNRNGIQSEFEAKANENPQVSLHGGPTGFDSVVWTVLGTEEKPLLFSNTEIERIHALPAKTFALFRLISPDGDQGYPGELLTEVLMALVPSTSGHSSITKLGHVVIAYRSKLADGKAGVTPVNLTQHWGFNMNASLSDRLGTEIATIKDHVIRIEADDIAKRDKLSLPTGDYTPVSSAPVYDFRKSKEIGKDFPEGGYDDYFRLNSSAIYPTPKHIRLSDLETWNSLDAILAQAPLNAASAVQLASEKTRIALDFFSNQRGLMFYTNDLADPAKGARKLIHGGSGISGHGDAYGPGTAVFLEFHDPLAAFLQPENRDADDTMITSEELYNNFVRLEIGFMNA